MPSLLEIGPVVLEKKIFNVFLLFRNYLPFEKSLVFIWTNLNSLHLNSLHLRMFWAKFALNLHSGSGENVFLLFCYKLPFGKGMAYIYLYTVACVVVATSNQWQLPMSGQFWSCLFIFSLYFNWFKQPPV